MDESRGPDFRELPCLECLEQTVADTDSLGNIAKRKALLEPFGFEVLRQFFHIGYPKAVPNDFDQIESTLIEGSQVLSLPIFQSSIG